MTDIVERLRSQDPNGLSILLSIHEAIAEIERLRAALNELTTEITQSSVLMDNISLAKFENACRALEPKP